MLLFFIFSTDGTTSVPGIHFGMAVFARAIPGAPEVWWALNLDGGGSSQMWFESGSYVNDYDGNNNGSGTFSEPSMLPYSTSPALRTSTNTRPGRSSIRCASAVTIFLFSSSIFS